MLIEYEPVESFFEPEQLKIIYKEGCDDLDIQLGSGIYIGNIFIGKILPQYIVNQILYTSKLYQSKIREDYLSTKSIQNEEIRNRYLSRLFIDCFNNNWQIFKYFEQIGLQSKPELVRLYSGHYEMWNDDLNKFNIVDIVLPFDYLHKY